MVEMEEVCSLQWYVKEKVLMPSTRICSSIRYLVRGIVGSCFVWDVICWLSVIGALNFVRGHTTMKWQSVERS